MKTQKKCCHCKKTKPLTAFSPSAVKRRSAQCNECITEIRKEKMRSNGILPHSDRITNARKTVNGIDFQLCSRCNQYKPLQEFPPSHVKKVSTFAVCHSCMREETKAYRHSRGVKDWSEIAVKRRVIKGIEHQECPSCSEMKPVSDFHKDKSNQNGYSRICKECASEQHYERKQKAKKQETLPKAEVIKLVCEGCNKPFGILKSEYDLRRASGYPAKYCSQKCTQEWCRHDTRMAKDSITRLLRKYGKVGGKL